MQEIELAWERYRESDGTLSEKYGVARREASKVLRSMFEAVKNSTCQHEDVLICFVCANDRKQFFDCSILREGYSDENTLADRETSYRYIMVKRFCLAKHA